VADVATHGAGRTAPMMKVAQLKNFPLSSKWATPAKGRCAPFFFVPPHATVMVRALATKEEFDSLLAASGDKAVVVDFTATWCGPCQRIAPIYEQLANEFPQCVFVKVDVDDNQETAMACGVSAMPTFKIFKKGAVVGELKGADPDGLKKLVQEHAGSKFVGEGNTLGGSSEARVATTGMSEREKRLAALERRGLK
jgi:thioredoxin 1